MTGIDTQRTRRARSGTDGFTLIEVLVAFTILALVTLVVQRAVMTALRGTIGAGERIDTEMVARTLMTAPMGISTGTGTGTGAGLPQPAAGTMNGHPWTIRFEPVALPFPAQANADADPPAFAPARMIVSVGPRSGRGRPVTVETVRLVRTAAGTPP